MNFKWTLWIILFLGILFRDQGAALRDAGPQVCDLSACALPAQGCFYGQVRDGRDCCMVCAAGEGEACGGGGGGGGGDLRCGDGLRCESARGACVCVSSGPVCGSDGRTYRSICRLKAENRRAELGESPPVMFIQRGRCQSGDPGAQHPGSLRYRFNFIADVVHKIAPAVVRLDFFQRMPFSGQDVSVSSGCGFVVSEDGWIVTNAHVLANKRRTEVVLKGGARYAAEVKDVDRRMDVALLKIQPERPLLALRLGRSSDLRPGEFVVAIGSPLSVQGASHRPLKVTLGIAVTMGVTSSAQRSDLELGFQGAGMDYIQTDAMINYSNSGGPLVNLDGDVIGINTLKVKAGISFAVPADRIRRFLAKSYARQVDGNTAQKKKHIGVRMLPLSPTLIQDLQQRRHDFWDVGSGVYVYEVLPGSAADRAGLKEHDVIISINRRDVSSTQEVSDAVQSGVVLSVVVRRRDGDVTLAVVPEDVG